jgi:hypothetical protein
VQFARGFADMPRRSVSHILRVAKELIAREIGVIAASRLRREFELRIAERLLTIARIGFETDAFPIGSVRKEWNRKALESEKTRRLRRPSSTTGTMR